MNRRELLKTGGHMSLLGVLLSSGLLKPGFAFAADWNKALFGTTSVADTIKLMGGVEATPSTDIMFQAPDIAENGAVVPMTITSKIANTKSISILIEKNPNTLAANFDIPADTEPSVNTRVKMGQSSNVYAIVEADGKFYSAVKEVKVTLGGCGG